MSDILLYWEKQDVLKRKLAQILISQKDVECVPFNTLDGIKTKEHIDTGHNTSFLPGMSNKKGVYAIFCDGKCLYVGQTFYCIRYRVKRFLLAMFGIQRHDESHAGGEKARDSGYNEKTTSSWEVKYLDWHKIITIMNSNNIETNVNDLDEYVAHYLKSEFNTFRKDAYVPINPGVLAYRRWLDSGE